MSDSKFLTREFKENPEFYKAYPHLANSEYKEEIHKFVEKRGEEPLFQGLQSQHPQKLKSNDSEFMLLENEKNFVQAAHAHVDGPHKYLNDEQKLKVHQEIEVRMQQLEDTGLTRMEVLFDDKEGLGQNLKDDSFFQLIKGSRVAREMIVAPGAEFTADRVIEQALRQDFGPDPSMSNVQERFTLADDSNEQPLWEYKKKYRDRAPLLKGEHHFGGANFVERQQVLADQAREQPATFINRPLTRTQLRKRTMRSITKDEIDWKNLAFMTKFLNPSGKLYNRHQSRLETNVHRKVAKTVKKIRHLGLLPSQGLLMPTDKIPLGQQIDEQEEMHKKTIDPVTGRMYLRHQLTDDGRDKHRRSVQKNHDRNFHPDYEIKETSEEMRLRKEIIRDMSLDSHALVPNAAQREWLSAQAYLLQKMGALHEMEGIAEVDGKEYKDISKNMGPAGVKSAYKNVQQRIKETDDDKIKTGDGLFLNLVHEKSHELSKFAEKVTTPKEELLDGNYAEPTDTNEIRIRKKIQKLLDEAKGNEPDTMHANESVSTATKRGRKVARVPRAMLREPQML